MTHRPNRGYPSSSTPMQQLPKLPKGPAAGGGGILPSGELHGGPDEPEHLIRIDEPLTEEQAEAIKARWLAAYTNGEINLPEWLDHRAAAEKRVNAPIPSWITGDQPGNPAIPGTVYGRRPNDEDPWKRVCALWAAIIAFVLTGLGTLAIFGILGALGAFK